MVSCVRSPISATSSVVKAMPAIRMGERWARRWRCSSAVPLVRWRQRMTAPTAKRAATASFTGRSGRRPSRPPAATATVTCTRNAAAAPNHTQKARRYVVVRTSVATIVLSGSSARNTTAKVAKNRPSTATV